MIPNDYLILPAGTMARYLAEGAANIVFRISLPPGTPEETVLETYDDTTPPPSEIESTPRWQQAFESKRYSTLKFYLFLFLHTICSFSIQFPLSSCSSS